MTDYTVMKRDEERPNTWIKIGDVTAANPVAAVRKKIQTPEFADPADASQGGVFIAIPARSFKAMQASPVSVTQIKIVLSAPGQEPEMGVTTPIDRAPPQPDPEPDLVRA